MEKRLLTTVLITILFLMAYNYFILGRYKKEALLPKKPSVYTESQQPVSIKQKITPSLPVKEEELPHTIIGNFSITYSPKGGYIHSITLVQYKEKLLYKNIGFVSDEKNIQFNDILQTTTCSFSNCG